MIGAAVLAVPLLLIVWVVGFASGQSCAPASITVADDRVPANLGAYGHEQLLNAATTINVGANHQAPAAAQTIALMVAITDSGLDEPLEAADQFYVELLAQSSWQSVAPSVAANTVLGGEDPYAYEDAYGDAARILAALGGSAACAPAAPGSVNSLGWAMPVEYTSITGTYGPRAVICVRGSCSRPFHYAVDLAAPRDSPIYAAAAGTVVKAGPNGGSGNTILVDHGNGIVTGYSHMYADGMLVVVGQHVSAGQVIGRVGCAGICTGDHLHFEVKLSGVNVNPVPFMAERGYVID
jgi:murein DD-endopeptidase MepM/ murein hydrolase activator NlpD